MPTVLVRSMPAKTYQEVKRMAKDENVSLSQEVIRLVLFALDEKEKKAIKEMEEQKEHEDVFERIRILREKIHTEYGGKKQEDSAKIIRRMRDERAKRYE